MTASRLLRSLLMRLAWLGVATLIAFGSAGVVAAMQHQPGTADRPELTFAGDEVAEPALDTATAALESLAEEVDVLGSTARQALATVVGGNLDTLQALIAEGTTQLAVVQRHAVALEESVAAIPGMEDGVGQLIVSEGLRRRYAELVATRDLTTGLETDWTAFAGRAQDAASLTALLARHDLETAAAAKEGSAAHYPAALVLLETSDATIAEARGLAARLGKAADVSTLITWLDRNAAYDIALRGVYQSLLDAKGRITDTVHAALAAEKKARSMLPADTRGLVVIMAEVAQGGMNQAVISIEETRGALAGALDIQAEIKAELKASPALPQ